MNAGDWRGEWRSRGGHSSDQLRKGPGRLPVLLRFNFVQHQQDTGTSASWAGPDRSRPR